MSVLIGFVIQSNWCLVAYRVCCSAFIALLLHSQTSCVFHSWPTMNGPDKLNDKFRFVTLKILFHQLFFLIFLSSSLTVMGDGISARQVVHSPVSHEWSRQAQWRSQGQLLPGVLHQLSPGCHSELQGRSGAKFFPKVCWEMYCDRLF